MAGSQAKASRKLAWVQTSAPKQSSTQRAPICVKLPRHGPDFIGAMAFLALLAYPEPSRLRRDKVVFACKAHVIKAAKRVGAPHKMLRKELLSYPIEKIRAGPVSQAWRRIVNRRIPAAMMAEMLMLTREGKTGAIRVKVKLDGQVVGENISAVADAVATHLEANKIADMTRQNMLTRVWKESSPVLHLAVALNSVLQKLPPGRISFFTLLNKPSWVRQAISSAEIVRKMLPAYGIEGGSIQLTFKLE